MDAETPASIGQLPTQDVFRQPPFDVIGTQQRLEETQPLVQGWIGGQAVTLAMPDVATSGGRRRVVPLTPSRMRRASDIYYSRAADPYVRSALTGLGQTPDENFQRHLECLDDCDSWWQRTFGDVGECAEVCIEEWVQTLPPAERERERARPPPPDLVGPDVRERLQARSKKAATWMYVLPAVTVVGIGAILLWPKKKSR